MRNAGLEEAQAVIKIAGRNINNLRYADDTTLMAQSKEESKSLFDEGEREECKSWLKTQHSENEDHCIRSHHFMGNRWGNSGNSIILYFLGLFVTPMDRSPPDSSVHEILQARILEWIAISFSGGLLNPGIKPVSCLAGGFFTTETPRKQCL